MVRQQRNEVLLDRLPEGIVFGVGQRIEIEIALNGGGRFGNAQVVKVDALTSTLANRVPIAILEQRLRLLCDIPKAAIVVIKSIENRARNRQRRRHRAVEADRVDRSIE